MEYLDPSDSHTPPFHHSISLDCRFHPGLRRDIMDLYRVYYTTEVVQMRGPWLSGDKINLRSLRDADGTRRVEWLNDSETVRLFTGIPLIRKYEYGMALQWRQIMESETSAIVWGIETKNHRHIGDVDLHAINRIYNTARLTILIGDRAYWGQGYGTDVLQTLLRYAFDDMELFAVNLRVFNFNHRAVRCYEKCGFMQISASDDNSWPMGSAPQKNEIFMTITKDRLTAERLNAKALYASSR